MSSFFKMTAIVGFVLGIVIYFLKPSFSATLIPATAGAVALVILWFESKEEDHTKRAKEESLIRKINELESRIKHVEEKTGFSENPFKANIRNMR